MRTDYVDPKTMWRVVDALRPQNALVMELCLETGLRVGDAVALPLSALHGQSVSYRAQKTGKLGTAKISPDLFRKLLRNADGFFLFPSRRSKSGHITRQAVWADVKRCAHVLGVAENVAPHSARKVFAVEHMKTEGVAAVQRELQHGDLGTTLLYCLSDKRLFGMNEEVIDRLYGIEQKLDRILEILEK